MKPRTDFSEHCRFRQVILESRRSLLTVLGVFLASICSPPRSIKNTRNRGCYSLYSGPNLVFSRIRSRLADALLQNTSIEVCDIKLTYSGVRYLSVAALNTSIEGCLSLFGRLQLSFNNGLNFIARDHLDAGVFSQRFQNRVRGFAELELKEHARTGTVASSFEIHQ